MCRDLSCERKYIYYSERVWTFDGLVSTGCAAREVGWTLLEGHDGHRYAVVSSITAAAAAATKTPDNKNLPPHPFAIFFSFLYTTDTQHSSHTTCLRVPYMYIYDAPNVLFFSENCIPKFLVHRDNIIL